MVSNPPGIRLSNIAKACNGMSGRVVAWVAGERSSVFVSPGTLNTVTVMVLGSFGRPINQSASAQASMTCLAKGLTSDKCRTSLKASKTNRVLLRAVAAAAAIFSSPALSKSIRDWTL